MLNLYEITNKTSGQNMGVWAAPTKREAIDGMIREGDPTAVVDDYDDWIVVEIDN